MKIQDHDELPKLDHRLPLPTSGGIIERRVTRLPGARPGKAGSHLGNFQTANLGSSTPAMTPRGIRLIAKLPHGRWRTLTFLEALRCDRIAAPCVIDGPINGTSFRA